MANINLFFFQKKKKVGHLFSWKMIIWWEMCKPQINLKKPVWNPLRAKSFLVAIQHQNKQTHFFFFFWIDWLNIWKIYFIFDLVGEKSFDRRRHPPGAFSLATSTTRDTLRNDGRKRATERACPGPWPGELRIDPATEKREDTQQRRRRQSKTIPSSSGR